MGKKRHSNPTSTASVHSNESPFSSKLIKFSPCSRFLISPASPSRVSIWRARDGIFVSSLLAKNGREWTCVSWVMGKNETNAERLLLGCNDGSLWAGHVMTGDVTCVEDSRHKGPILDLVMSSHRTVATLGTSASGEGEVKCSKLNSTCQRISSAPKHFDIQIPSKSCRALGMSRDSKVLVVTDHSPSFYSIKDGKKLGTPRGGSHESPIQAVMEVIPGFWISVSDKERRAMLWDSESCQGIYRGMHAHPSAITTSLTGLANDEAEATTATDIWQQVLVCAATDDASIQFWEHSGEAEPAKKVSASIKYGAEGMSDPPSVLACNFTRHAKQDSRSFAIQVAWGIASKPQFDCLKFIRPSLASTEDSGSDVHSWSKGKIWKMTKPSCWSTLSSSKLKVEDSEHDIKVLGTVSSGIDAKLAQAENRQFDETAAQVQSVKAAKLDISQEAQAKTASTTKSVEDKIRDRMLSKHVDEEAKQQPTPDVSPEELRTNGGYTRMEIEGAEMTSEDDEGDKTMVTSPGDDAENTQQISEAMVDANESQNRRKRIKQPEGAGLQDMLHKALSTDDHQLFEECLRHTAALGRSTGESAVSLASGTSGSAGTKSDVVAEELIAQSLMEEAVKTLPARLVVTLLSKLLQALATSTQTPSKGLVICCWLEYLIAVHQNYLTFVSVDQLEPRTTKVKAFLEDWVARTSRLSRLEWRLSHLHQQSKKRAAKRPKSFTVQNGARMLCEEEKKEWLRMAESKEGHPVFVDDDSDDEVIVSRKHVKQNHSGRKRRNCHHNDE